MDKKTFHAVVYGSRSDENWVAFCVEYDISSQGESPDQALEMLQEAVALHLDGIEQEQLDAIDNDVGTDPVLKAFSISAPAILQ